MSKRDDIVDIAGNDELLFMDPERFDAAIIGVTERMGQLPTICYNKNKVLEILMEDGMDYDEAIEYYEFNVVGAWMGEQTPTFLEVL
jgi:hypothetical protein